MTVTVSGRLVCRTGEEASRVRALLPDHAALSRNEPGCLAFSVEPTDDPLVWQVVERFVDRDALAAHRVRLEGTAWTLGTAGLPRDYTIRDA